MKRWELWIILGIFVLFLCAINWLEISRTRLVQTQVNETMGLMQATQVEQGTWRLDIRDSPLFWGD